MKNWELILAEAGITLTDEQKTRVAPAMLENYRTIADYNNVVSKRDELQTSLGTVQTELDKFKEMKPEDLQAQITTLNQTLESERNERKRVDARRDLEGRVDAFLGKTENGKKVYEFVNEITAKSIRNSILETLDKEESKGKSIDEVFKGLTTDAEGNAIQNILVNGQKKGKFTDTKGGNNGGNGGMSLKDMTYEERVQLKRTDPELYASLRNR